MPHVHRQEDSVVRASVFPNLTCRFNATHSEPSRLLCEYWQTDSKDYMVGGQRPRTANTGFKEQTPELSQCMTETALDRCQESLGRSSHPSLAMRAPRKSVHNRGALPLWLQSPPHFLLLPGKGFPAASCGCLQGLTLRTDCNPFFFSKKSFWWRNTWRKLKCLLLSEKPNRKGYTLYGCNYVASGKIKTMETVNRPEVGGRGDEWVEHRKCLGQ